ncbi:Conserved protein of uncharacterised function%2C Alanine and Proline rich%2C possibly secreted [Mycobacterium tuberculosis]|nr:Conserved protein of uncharacterised function%2C Alanine and Proline rich%2C possibly secreted [Mycobacterium tuberculosis]
MASTWSVCKGLAAVVITSAAAFALCPNAAAEVMTTAAKPLHTLQVLATVVFSRCSVLVSLLTDASGQRGEQRRRPNLCTHSKCLPRWCSPGVRCWSAFSQMRQGSAASNDGGQTFAHTPSACHGGVLPVFGVGQPSHRCVRAARRAAVSERGSRPGDAAAQPHSTATGLAGVGPAESDNPASGDEPGTGDATAHGRSVCVRRQSGSAHRIQERRFLGEPVCG